MTTSIVSVQRRAVARRGLHIPFLWYDIRRQLTPQNLLFSVALPAVLYLALFAITEPSNGVTLPHGNFRAWMMIGIAIYGGSIGAVARAAGIAHEKNNGWLRTIRLSPLGPGGYVATRIVSCQVYAALPVLVIGALGAVTGAQADLPSWIAGLGVAWIGAVIFSAFGIFLGLALPAEIVLHIPGVVMTAFAFLGNIFIPLSGTLLTVSQFTPLYGITTLARYSLTEGQTFSGDQLSLLGAVINVVLWFSVFTLAATRQFARATARQ